MSKLLVSQYHTEVEKIIQYGGSRKETFIRVAFQNLINEYCKPRDFQLIPELDYKTRNGKIVYPDGTVKDALRLDWGYWESKDQYDNLNQEIDKKLAKGYPDSNILFEDSQTAVLIQGGNESLRVSILPYYIANLNIEYTYKQKMGVYEEFENICFVDTLEHTSFAGKQMNLFAMSVENTKRIKQQNESKISVIIGNPPYNANQANENDNNKNRSYPVIDKLIKDSYIKYSTAQKTKVYDPYARFLRWATNRLNENGILGFITNSSFINARTFDGFRKVVNDEFSEIYVIDLGGDVRANPKISGTKHNVFGIQTGVAISFMVKKKGSSSTPCKIFYTRRPEFESAEDKLKFLAATKFTEINFEHITPDKSNNWINIADPDFDSLLPLVDKDTKFAKSKANEKSVFKLYSNGVVTARDEWLYHWDATNLAEKIQYYLQHV
ncbi:MAG: Eco57I restriction-modification methylase domain-containing protein [Hassallia sp.]